MPHNYQESFQNPPAFDAKRFKSSHNFGGSFRHTAAHVLRDKAQNGK